MKNLKKRAISWLLTVAMTASLLPTALLPGAMAAQTGKEVTVESFTWNKDTGAFTVVLSSPASASTGLGAWYLMVVPELKVAGNMTPQEALDAAEITAGNASDGSSVSSKMAENTGMNATMWGVASGNGNKTWDGSGKVTITGTLPDFNTLTSRLAGKKNASDATYNKGDDIPFTFVFRSSTGGPSFQYGDMEESIPAELYGGPYTVTADDDNPYPVAIMNKLGAADATVAWSGVTISDDASNGGVGLNRPGGTATIPGGGDDDPNTDLTLSLDWDTLEGEIGAYVVLDVPYTSAGSSTT